MTLALQRPLSQEKEIPSTIVWAMTRLGSPWLERAPGRLGFSSRLKKNIQMMLLQVIRL